MAVRNIAVTDTLEKFRTEFNDLNSNDFGDIANLSNQISATNLVEAMNETISIATSTAGWTMEDASSTQQIVGGGDVARFLGASNQINVVVSAPDAGTLTIAGGSLTDTSGTITMGDDDLNTTGSITGANMIGTTGQFNTIQARSGNEITLPSTQTLKIDGTFKFEGTANDHETTLGVVDPTADNTINLPDNSGTIITTGSIDAVTETMMANDAIGATELKSVVQLIIYNSSGVAQKTLYGAGA